MKTKKTFDNLLDEVVVMPPGMWHNEKGPKGWFAVSDNEGIKAYFADETQALFYRLALINATLNLIKA